MAAIEYGIPYQFWNPTSTVAAVLNDPSALGFCGYVSDITGLDHPGVRENAQVVVAGDGGYHGRFWRDRRPWTFSGTIMPQFPLTSRDYAQEILEMVLGQAMQADGHLLWTPADGIPRKLDYRLQQPVRISKGQSNAVRTFQIACVSADYRIKSQATHTVTATGVFPLNLPSVVNAGNTDSALAVVVFGPCNGFALAHLATGKSLIIGATLTASDFCTVDLRTPYPQVSINNVLQLGLVNILSDWSTAVVPGTNNFQVQSVLGGSTSATSATLYWEDSWL